jgi:hypothetical protein
LLVKCDAAAAVEISANEPAVIDAHGLTRALSNFTKLVEVFDRRRRRE